MLGFGLPECNGCFDVGRQAIAKLTLIPKVRIGLIISIARNGKIRRHVIEGMNCLLVDILPDCPSRITHSEASPTFAWVTQTILLVEFLDFVGVNLSKIIQKRILVLPQLPPSRSYFLPGLLSDSPLPPPRRRTIRVTILRPQKLPINRIECRARRLWHEGRQDAASAGFHNCINVEGRWWVWVDLCLLIIKPTALAALSLNRLCRYLPGHLNLRFLAR